MTPLQQRLRDLLDARGLRPRTLSIKAGLNPTAVRDILEGRSQKPLYSTLSKLAVALSCDIRDLVPDERELSDARALETLFDEQTGAKVSDLYVAINALNRIYDVKSLRMTNPETEPISSAMGDAKFFVQAVPLISAGPDSFKLGLANFWIPHPGIDIPAKSLIATVVRGIEMARTYMPGDVVFLDNSELPANDEDAALIKRADRDSRIFRLCRMLGTTEDGDYRVHRNLPTPTEEVVSASEWRVARVAARICSRL